MTERCSKCGGPVELIDPWVADLGVRALPDTLEGIEAEGWALVGNPSERAALYHQALTRLFQGCTECGREPCHPASEFAKSVEFGERAGKRQAWLEAADLLPDPEAEYDDVDPDDGLASKSLRVALRWTITELRKKAEGV